MKWSIYIIVLLCAISLLLTSCNNSTIESTPNIFSDSKDIAMETTNCSASDIIVETEKTLNSSFETETTLLESSFKENSEPVENTNQSYTTYETIPDQFESLMKVKSKNGEDGVYFYPNADITQYDFREYCMIRFRVLGVDHSYAGKSATMYYVQLIDVYGHDDFDPQKIYRLAYRGKLDEQVYGKPPLEPGKEYLKYLTPDELENDFFQMSLIMPLADIDGVTYVYGYGIDMGRFACALEITDWEENQIYKVGKHDKIIAYLSSIKKELPTFDYKCELYSLLGEMGFIE